MRRGYSREPDRVALRTEARRAHFHVAIFDENGNGFTTPGPDGHFHYIKALDVLDAGEGAARHTHELSTERQDLDELDDVPEEPRRAAVA